MTTLLLTVKEAATELRVSPDTVYRRISAGLLRAVNIAEPGDPSRTRIRRADLEKYIASCTAPALRKGTAA